MWDALILIIIMLYRSILIYASKGHLLSPLSETRGGVIEQAGDYRVPAIELANEQRPIAD